MMTFTSLCSNSSFTFFANNTNNSSFPLQLLNDFPSASLLNTPIEQFETMLPSATLVNGSMHYQNVLNTFQISNLTELSLYLLLVYVIFNVSIFKTPKFISRTWLNISVEIIVRALGNFIKANGTLAQQAYLPLFMVVGLSLSVYNFGGLFPFGYTFSAHIVCTFFYSFTIFFGLNYVSLMRYRENFFNIFLPAGTSFGMTFLMVALEIISYISRPFSMAIRLFANLMAGHSLLKILLSFSFQGFNSSKTLFIIITIFSLVIISLILAMECVVAGLQIFVFLTLMCLYLADVHTVKH